MGPDVKHRPLCVWNDISEGDKYSAARSGIVRRNAELKGISHLVDFLCNIFDRLDLIVIVVIVCSLFLFL